MLRSAHSDSSAFRGLCGSAFQRRRALPLVFLSSLALPLFASSDIAIHRERDGWTVTVRGSMPHAPAEIHLLAGGDINVRGSRVRGITYTVTQHFSAADFPAGQRQVHQVAVELSAAIERGSTAGSLSFPCTNQPVRVEIPRASSKLTVLSVAGNIDVANVDGAVSTRNGAGRTILDYIAGDTNIRTAGGATTLGLIGGNLHCVSGGGGICARTIRGESFFETSGGEIYAAEAFGPVRAYTGAGRIRIGHAGSSVNATTQGGPIEIGRAEGLVIANNSGGPIRVSSAPGVRCSTASGAIQLNGVTGNMVASTTLGNIIASLFNAGFDPRLLSNSFLQTGGGDITVLIPSNISVTVRATSTGGTRAIISDYPIRLSTRGRVLTAEGLINGGGPLLQIAGKDGTISIKRQ